VSERKGADRIAFTIPDGGALRNFLHDNVVVDVHVEDAPVLFDIIGQLWRAKDIERLLSVHLTRQHENARQPCDVVRVHVRDENRSDLFPAEIEPADRNLGTLPRIEEKEFPFAANEHARKLSIRQGHHAARTKYKCL
jgi:hypothetical protein